MKVNGNAVLITGGATGIGLSLAEAFINAGSEVIVCGRTEESLNRQKTSCPSCMLKNATFPKKRNERRYTIGPSQILRILTSWSIMPAFNE